MQIDYAGAYRGLAVDWDDNVYVAYGALPAGEGTNPSPLKGGIVESPDIRAGMAMLLAALAAEGSSTIHNVGQIERGYERIDERLRALGADIERVDD